MKYYGVHKGRDGLTGAVFTSWDECKPHVIGVQGAEFKSFSDRAEAEAFANGAPVVKAEPKTPPGTVAPEGSKGLRIYVDGSYNKRSDTCGFAAFIRTDSDFRVIYGGMPMSCGGRNVEGEVAGAEVALEFLRNYAERGHHEPAVIYHDYEGIGKWGDGEWSASRPYTKDYVNIVRDTRAAGVNVKFVHVDGHTGVEGNEFADVLAKAGCGVPLTRAEQHTFELLTKNASYVAHKDREPLLKEPEIEHEQLMLDL